MLVHLSKSSPYLCDLSLGPIEQANRMASLPTKRLLPYLEMKESFPKQTRTPLKLLAAEEIPLNTSLPPTASANDTNSNSREQSLQPIWYTEQTIVDENVESVPISHHVNNLQVIESDSPRLIEPQASLMRKSSTFTIDPLNDSEKENDANIIITSTQKQTLPPNERSEESFRALEHLLGLGSANNNFTMTTTNHESPKSNHDTLSLTIVTPTDLINNTTAASLHLSYMPMGGGVGSLPSSQNVLLMPTIESTSDPSINTTMPAPFSVDNSDVDEVSPSNETTSSLAPENIQQTENSLQFTDDSDENNLSYPLNQSIETPTVNSIRPPTSADVAYRALIKPRAVGRISQPVKMVSPLASKTKPAKITVRSSLPAPSTRVLRSSTRRISIKLPEEISISNEETLPTTKLIEVVTVPEEEEEIGEEESPAGITLNLTVDKGVAMDSIASVDDADCSASLSETSPNDVEEMETKCIEPLAPILSQEFSYTTPTLRPSARARSNPSSPILEATIEDDEEHQRDRVSLSSMKSNLSILSANTTGISEAPPIILQKSLAGSASPSPNATPIISTTRPSERLSMNFSPRRRSINPLHSSTPSIRNKSLQIVSIGEEEQISTMAPEPFRADEPIIDAMTMIDQQQQVNIPMEMVTDEGIQTSPVRPPVRIEISTQTTPSLDPSYQRQYSAIEQQTTPISKRSFECQTTPVPIVIHRSLTQQTSPVEVESSPPIVEQEPHTPIHTKPVIQLRRNVRFQFTPSTDARLAAKEKLEDDQQRVKQEIPPVNPTIVSDNEHEDEIDEEIRKSTTKKKKKKKTIGSKKKSTETLSKVEECVEEIVREDLTMESPILSIPSEPLIDAEDTVPKKKRSARIEKKSSPRQDVEVMVAVTSPPATTKRINSRKRPNPKTTTASEVHPETISPTEPVLKRAKTSETKHSTRVPSPEIPSTRSRSKTQRKTSSSPESATTTTTTTSVSNKRKNLTSSTTKKGKRRLHNAEQDEGLNTADEDEPIIIEPTAETEVDLTVEEREKIEAMTVVELKNRLITHGETVPKGVRKADLVALVMKIEIQLHKERRQAETPVEMVTHPPMRKTRRKKS